MREATANPHALLVVASLARFLTCTWSVSVTGGLQHDGFVILSVKKAYSEREGVLRGAPCLGIDIFLENARRERLLRRSFFEFRPGLVASDQRRGSWS